MEDEKNAKLTFRQTASPQLHARVLKYDGLSQI